MTIQKPYSLEIRKQLILLISFALPLNKAIVPLLIVFLILTWLFEGNFKSKFIKYQQSYFILIVSFYLLHLVGLLYTQNMQSGLFDIEQKLSLLIFPFIFLGDDLFDEDFLKKILRNFILGCLIGCSISIVNSAIHYFYSNSIDSFFYVQFSSIMHPSYYSLYLAFATSVVLFDNSIFGKTFYKIPITIFFLVGILLLSSKSGIVSIMIVFVFKFFHILLIKKNFVKAAIILLIFSVLLSTIIVRFPRSIERLKDMFATIKSDNEQLNTTSTRLVIWQHSFQIIKSNFLIGVGTGDANDELEKTYSADNEHELKERKFNAHNQYLQTTIALGIIGLLALLLPYFILLIAGLKGHLQSIIFITLVAVNYLFESMLETQAGVVFITFFLVIYLSNNNLVKKVSY